MGVCEVTAFPSVKDTSCVHVLKAPAQQQQSAQSSAVGPPGCAVPPPAAAPPEAAAAPRPAARKKRARGAAGPGPAGTGKRGRGRAAAGPADAAAADFGPAEQLPTGSPIFGSFQDQARHHLLVPCQPRFTMPLQLVPVLLCLLLRTHVRVWLCLTTVCFVA